MPLKASKPPGEYEEIDRWAGGVGWLAYPDERMKRASHALRLDPATGATVTGATAGDSGRSPDPEAPADVWLVDPLRGVGVEDMVRDLGNVVGVVVLLGRHSRDAVTFARRFDVPLYLPVWVDVEVPEDVGIVRIEDGLPGTEFELLETVDLPLWHEAALYDGETLVVGDSVGTASYFTTSGESLGVHPLLRLFPPKTLDGLTPDRILTGHGDGVFEDATTALSEALENARSGAPRVWWNALKGLVSRGDSDAEDDADDQGVEQTTVD